MRKKSLYFILALILLTTISGAMFVHAAYSYWTIKTQMTKQMKESAKNSVTALEKNIAALMSAYSVNEYELLVKNQMLRSDIFSIVVEDFNMGKIVSQESYKSGYLRDENQNVIEYNPKNPEHTVKLESCDYAERIDIVSATGTKLGRVSVYTSNTAINNALREIIYNTLVTTFIILFFLIGSLFFAIRHFIAKPISDIVESLSLTGENGVPKKMEIKSYSKEICILVDSINRMNVSIADSKKALTEQNEHLQELVEIETSKRIEKEKILLRQSKMAMMGEMIGAIAHQWRQPLNALGLNVQDIGYAYKYGELSDEYISDFKERSMSIIHRMSKTIDDFRNFFKPDEAMAVFGVKDAIGDALSIVGQQLKNNSISFELKADDKYEVRGYQNEFVQTALILLSNAQDVLLERGIENPKIEIDVKPSGEKKLEISFLDNGGGIDEGIMDRIFEPYFTTKEQGKGTGIGLYMAKEIIERQMKGELSVQNSEGGAKFVIKLERIENEM